MVSEGSRARTSQNEGRREAYSFLPLGTGPYSMLIEVWTLYVAVDSSIGELRGRRHSFLCVCLLPWGCLSFEEVHLVHPTC